MIEQSIVQTNFTKEYPTDEELRQLWMAIAPSLIARTCLINYTDGKILINVTDSLIMHQLILYKKLYIDKFNLELEKRCVRDITFHVGTVNPKAFEKTPEQRLQELATMPYEEYLKTPEWKAKAKQKRKEVGNKCQLCNRSSKQSEGPLHVHHRTYARRGNEDMLDLTVLCAGCHELFHNNRLLVKG